jgi:hypothetical protein
VLNIEEMWIVSAGAAGTSANAAQRDTTASPFGAVLVPEAFPQPETPGQCLAGNS